MTHKSFTTVVDETGNRYGLLSVIERSGTDRSGSATWRCSCDCGGEVTTRGSSLRNGDTKSCGCIDTATKHGGFGTPEYDAWTSLISRCCNQNDRNFSNYGGRGITVCARWRTSFPAFLDDMGKKPSDALSIDRIDNNGPYSPENCRWATHKEQANNTRRNVIIEHDDKRMSLAQWSLFTGISQTSLRRRINKGWSIERILTTPPCGPGRPRNTLQ